MVAWQIFATQFKVHLVTKCQRNSLLEKLAMLNIIAELGVHLIAKGVL